MNMINKTSRNESELAGKVAPIPIKTCRLTSHQVITIKINDKWKRQYRKSWRAHGRCGIFFPRLTTFPVAALLCYTRAVVFNNTAFGTLALFFRPSIARSSRISRTCCLPPTICCEINGWPIQFLSILLHHSTILKVSYRRKSAINNCLVCVRCTDLNRSTGLFFFFWLKQSLRCSLLNKVSTFQIL